MALVLLHSFQSDFFMIYSFNSISYLSIDSYNLTEVIGVLALSLNLAYK